MKQRETHVKMNVSNRKARVIKRELNANEKLGKYYRVGGLVFPTATLTPTALWILEAQAFIWSFSTYCILLDKNTNTHVLKLTHLWKP